MRVSKMAEIICEVGRPRRAAAVLPAAAIADRRSSLPARTSRRRRIAFDRPVMGDT